MEDKNKIARVEFPLHTTVQMEYLTLGGLFLSVREYLTECNKPEAAVVIRTADGEVLNWQSESAEGEMPFVVFVELGKEVAV
jgi:hypothetical protein